MCTRFTLRTAGERLLEFFDVHEIPTIEPRYNVAPSEDVTVVVQDKEGHRAIGTARWGLIPHWAKDARIGMRMLNARAETLHELPAFKSAFRRHRCLIPADGFYEWAHLERAGKPFKQPYYITLKDGSLFAFAGLWERWEGPDGTVTSCAIVTTDADDLVERIHPRMPVIIDPREYDLWLDRREEDAVMLSSLLQPYPSELLTMAAVGAGVGNPRNKAAECIEAIDDPLG